MLLKNFLQLKEWRCSWNSILISIYLIDAHDLKNGNMCERENDEKMLSVWTWIQLENTHRVWMLVWKIHCSWITLVSFLKDSIQILLNKYIPLMDWWSTSNKSKGGCCTPEKGLPKKKRKYMDVPARLDNLFISILCTFTTY